MHWTHRKAGLYVSGVNEHGMWAVIGLYGGREENTFYRRTDLVGFTMTSDAPFVGITRSFTSFSQAARENAESRILGGIHFRSACENGLALGESIGRRVIAHHLQRYQP